MASSQTIALPKPLPTLDAVPKPLPTLEELAFYYGTDKNHDDHKYVDLYAALFDPVRLAAKIPRMSLRSA